MLVACVLLAIAAIFSAGTGMICLFLYLFPSGFDTWARKAQLRACIILFFVAAGAWLALNICERFL